MKQKRKYRSVSFSEAIEIVGAWHSGRATQKELAIKYGVDSGHISRLCNGTSQPEAYAAVEAAERSRDQGELA